jgi:hypothetical protein
MADPRPTKLIVDCATGERTVVELTDEEIAEREAMAEAAVAEEAARQAEAEALQALKDSAKAKLVAGTPLTEQEASVLVI